MVLRTTRSSAPARDAAAPEILLRRATDARVWAFLERAPGQPRFAYTGESISVAGTGVAAELRADGPQRLARIRDASAQTMHAFRVVREPGVPADVGPVWIGQFHFAPDGPARFVLPRSTLFVRDGNAWQIHAEPVGPTRAAAAAYVPENPTRTSGWVAEPAFDVWAERVRSALQLIRAGRLQKLVIARRLVATLPRPLDLVRLCSELADRSRQSRTYYLELEPGAAFLGSSPELLAGRAGGRFETAALAGSRPRGRDAGEDEALVRSLVASSKEAWEHELVSRFLRQRLEARGRPWRTITERSVLRLPNVQHLESRFEADAGPDEHLLDFAGSLHPTPAVAGAPIDAALTELARLEPEDRGPYAGAVGWFSATGDGELSVALRCAEARGQVVRLVAGCGIVNESDPAEEWQESNTKFELLRGAIDAAGGAAP